MENETKSFWSKSYDELDVKESLVVVGLTAIVAVGGLFVVPYTITGISKTSGFVKAKIQKRKDKKAIKELEEKVS
jgi:hypothetical protein